MISPLESVPPALALADENFGEHLQVLLHHSLRVLPGFLVVEPLPLLIGIGLHVGPADNAPYQAVIIFIQGVHLDLPEEPVRLFVPRVLDEVVILGNTLKQGSTQPHLSDIPVLVLMDAVLFDVIRLDSELGGEGHVDEEVVPLTVSPDEREPPDEIPDTTLGAIIGSGDVVPIAVPFINKLGEDGYFMGEAIPEAFLSHVNTPLP